MKATNFSLPDQNGKEHSLSDYRGKWVVLYFYPKDNTPGCTKEACSFRDGYSELKNSNVVVIGVSKDSVASHKKFANKYKLPFILLSDEKTKVIKQYHALGEKKMFGRTLQGVKRITYLINPKGETVKVYKKVKPSEHAQEILTDIKSLTPNP